MVARSLNRELAVDTTIYGLAAGFAAINAAFARLIPHQVWGQWALGGLATGAVVSAILLAGNRAATRTPTETAARVRAVILMAVFVASVLAPMAHLSIDRAEVSPGTDQPVGTAQSEVIVIEAMADRLVHVGSPYLDPDEIRVEAARPRVGFRAYAPYQPAMAVFGLPRVAAAGWLTDARMVFLVGTALIGLAAVRIGRLDPIRTAQVLTIVHPAGLTLATGGDDLPVIALCVLALALAARRRWGWAGVVVGAALAIKLTAAPVALVLIVLAGRQHWRRVALVALGIPSVTLLPLLVTDRAAVIENLVRYPLGLTAIRTTAQSALPGVWLAEHVPGGRLIALTLVAAAAAALMWRLWRHPPRSAREAAWLAAATMAAAVMFAPAARFGYLAYPITFGAIGAMMIRSEIESTGDDERGSDGAGDPDVLRGDGSRSHGAAATGRDRGTVRR